MWHNNIKTTKTISEYNTARIEYLYEYPNGTTRRLTIDFEDKNKKKVKHVRVEFNGSTIHYDFYGYCYCVRRWTETEFSDCSIQECVAYYKNGVKKKIISVIPGIEVCSDNPDRINICYTYNPENILIEKKITTQPEMFGKKYINTTVIDTKNGVIKTNKEVEDDDKWNSMIETISDYIQSNNDILKAFTRMDYRTFKLFLEAIDYGLGSYNNLKSYAKRNNKHYTYISCLGYSYYEYKEMFFQILKKVKPDYSDDEFKNRFFPTNVKEATSLYAKGTIGKAEYYAFMIENELGIDRIEEMIKEGSLKMWIHNEYDELSDDELIDVFYKLLESILANRKKVQDGCIHRLDDFEKATINQVCGTKIR